MEKSVFRPTSFPWLAYFIRTAPRFLFGNVILGTLILDLFHWSSLEKFNNLHHGPIYTMDLMFICEVIGAQFYTRIRLRLGSFFKNIQARSSLPYLQETSLSYELYCLMPKLQENRLRFSLFLEHSTPFLRRSLPSIREPIVWINIWSVLVGTGTRVKRNWMIKSYEQAQRSLKSCLFWKIVYVADLFDDLKG